MGAAFKPLNVVNQDSKACIKIKIEKNNNNKNKTGEFHEYTFGAEI